MENIAKKLLCFSGFLFLSLKRFTLFFCITISSYSVLEQSLSYLVLN